MTLTVYHNPRCRKSREAIQYLQDKGLSFDIVKYLEQSFDKNTLGEVLKKIEKKPSEILRKNEVLWKKEYASKDLSEDQILQLLVKQPKLIERPIVTTTYKGVLARPIENLMEFLNKG
jgi:arsenate reductase